MYRSNVENGTVVGGLVLMLSWIWGLTNQLTGRSVDSPHLGCYFAPTSFLPVLTFNTQVS